MGLNGYNFHRFINSLGIGIKINNAGIDIPAPGIALQYRTGFPDTGTRLFPASAFLFIAVTD
jgi:hypothetical protein